MTVQQIKEFIDYDIGDWVKVESKLYSDQILTGLILDIEAVVEQGHNGEFILSKSKEFMVHLWVDEGLGMWTYNTKYWKIWRVPMRDVE